jgi:thiol-disulfide isomerase/thioredoxin
MPTSFWPNWSLARHWVVAVMIAWGSTGPQAMASGWQLPPQGYAFQPAAGCDRPQRSGQIYDSCADQMSLFLRARAEAYGAKKQMLVVFGANWCPSCRSLKAVLTSPVVMAREFNQKALRDRVQVIEIATSTLHEGRVVPVPSGEVVLRGLLAARPDVKQRVIPFVAMVDPVTGAVSARNLDDLDGPQGWDLPAIASALAAADEETRGGKPAPGEPGWLKRKLRRWLGP